MIRYALTRICTCGEREGVRVVRLGGEEVLFCRKCRHELLRHVQQTAFELAVWYPLGPRPGP